MIIYSSVFASLVVILDNQRWAFAYLPDYNSSKDQEAVKPGYEDELQRLLKHKDMEASSEKSPKSSKSTKSPKSLISSKSLKSLMSSKSLKSTTSDKGSNIEKEIVQSQRTNETFVDLIELDDFCSSSTNENQCEERNKCIWIDGNCVGDPPSCASFLRQTSCEENDFVDGCQWSNNRCFNSAIWEFMPTFFPTQSISSFPTALLVIPTEIISRGDPNGEPCPAIGGGSSPTRKPTRKPTGKPTNVGPSSSATTFDRGELTKDITRLGIRVSKGMSVRVVARANQKVLYGNGKKSALPFHAMPDGAAIFPLSNGYVYVSNSEVTRSNEGGVYGVYFDRNGNVIDYKMLLSGTTRNCSGGTTPWGTWISCEEFSKGQCWQVDPDPSGDNHSSPERTRLGGDGGFYEAVACDDRDPASPVFYVTEDDEFGALRKYTPPPRDNGGPANWNSLHRSGGTTEYLIFLPENRFTWSSCDDAARESQSISFPNVEGIDYYDGMLYFVSKVTLTLYILDLDNGTYTTSPTNGGLVGDGQFKHSPDQLVRNMGDFLYFTEDGGKTVGVYAVDTLGRRYAIFEAYDKMYFGDETTGLAFSPDGTKLYACFQDCGCATKSGVDCGCLLEFRRDDGKSFDGSSSRLKFHSI